MDFIQSAGLSYLLFFCPIFGMTQDDGDWKFHQPKDELINLEDELFSETRYRKAIRPIANDSESLFVYMEFILLSLVDVREKDQAIVTNALLEMEWVDYFLSWNSTRYGGVQTLLVEQQKIWLPDVVVANSVSPQDQLGFDELPVRLHSNGTVLWQPSSLITTSCDIVVTYYPFDTQLCNIDFVTAMSLNTEIDVNIHPKDPISRDSYNENGQWVLLQAWAENLSDEDSRSKIRFKLLIKRRTTFYLINIILPVLFLAMLSSLVFALPAEGGEKITIGITVLLAYAVYLTIVSGQLPNTSVQTSFLAIYLTSLLGVTALCVMNAVFNVRLHHRRETKPVGPKCRSVVNFLAKISCCSPLPEMEDSAPPRKNCIAPEDDGETQKLPSKKALVHDALSSTRGEYQVERVTWRDVAQILDWFCFLFYTTVNMFLTLFTILVLVVGSAINNPTFERAEPYPYDNEKGF